ncbi:serine hydrolase [Hymenobacter lutimineralis]|uniref:Serine hydrolase n=1 Tax=Hymenobacter lutimineralis TaxID=2606448 RepID=A0A5D6VIQ7_9BACT|nr:serine hydrolase [Hymenobacter lutimineralis]TYZ14274.1 serine hydrolase [Hymenobacter lutimineralis]
MKQLLWCLMLGWWLGLSKASAQPTVQPRLAAYMQAQAAVNHFAGVVLITRHDSVLLQQAYGLADYEWATPNTVDTKFALASITKTFTALAILQLAERDQLQLTDKLSKFFPGFPNGGAISLHQLLTHTAGLALDFEAQYLDYTNVSRDSALTVIQRLPVQFAPGARVGYSNVGYYLLGQIIEKASGLPYGEYLQRHILDVAGMTSTGLNSNTALVPRLARLYYREGESFVKNPYLNWALNVGHDGLYSTVGDLARLDQALRGTQLLSEASKALMATPHNQRFAGNGFLDRYGYGLFVNPYYNHGHALLTHSGGFFGAMTTWDRYPEDDILVTVLSNNEAESNWISYGLAGILFGKDVELPYVHRAISVAPEQLAALAGQYSSVTIRYANGQLYLQDLNTPLVPESERKFFRPDKPDRTVEFLINKRGKVDGLRLTKGGVKEPVQRKSRTR